MGVCSGCTPLEIAAPVGQSIPATRILDRCTPVHISHVAFKIPYVYDYINKLSMTQAIIN
jgi:hypothetical protein